MADPVRIDAKGLHYTPLNQKIRAAIAAGVKEIVIDNVLGQRFIGDGIRGEGVTLTVNGVPGGDLAMFMSGPTIIVHGNADHAPGNTMDMGNVIIHGGAGDARGEPGRALRRALAAAGPRASRRGGAAPAGHHA